MKWTLLGLCLFSGMAFTLQHFEQSYEKTQRAFFEAINAKAFTSAQVLFDKEPRLLDQDLIIYLASNHLHPEENASSSTFLEFQNTVMTRIRINKDSMDAYTLIHDQLSSANDVESGNARQYARQIMRYQMREPRVFVKVDVHKSSRACKCFVYTCGTVVCSCCGLMLAGVFFLYLMSGKNPIP